MKRMRDLPHGTAEHGRPKRLRADALLLVMVLVLACMLVMRYAGGDATLYPEGQGPEPYTETAAKNAPERPAAETAHEELREIPDMQDIPATGAPVRFLMHNVENYFVAGEQQRSRYIVKPKSAESREAVAEVIAEVKPELVGLVEIGGPKALADLRERLERRGLTYPYFRVLTRPGEDRALAVLSVYPIVQDHSVAQCRLQGKKNRMMLRGILDVTVELPDKRLFRVVGAHLKSRVAEDAAAAEALRQAESETLARHLRAALQQQPRVPLLVYGDWNDGPGDASAQVLKQGLSDESALSCLSPVDSRGHGWTIYYAAGGEFGTFDRIYVSKETAKRRRKGTRCGIVDIPAAGRASDHRAVWCELR